MWNIMLFFILFMGVTIPCCTGLCEFPVLLRNDWYSTDKGVLNFTASSVVEYPVFLSSNVSNMTFTCDEINVNRYILKGISTFTVFGNQLRPYLCLTLTQVSQEVFYYYILNRLESSINDRIFVRDDNFTMTADDICNRETPYEAGTFIMLVREGADPSSISRTCPDPILRQHQNVSIVSSDGSSRCDDVQLDVCSNTSILNITYQACAPALIYSAGGEFVCLFDLTENGVTYIALWNTDVSLTDGQTYRTSCYAIEEANGVTFGTEVPDRCHYNQTSQYSPPGGVYITMQNVTGT
ncbi:uncharacterized protein [Argopecten irradians]|uniref:uncharacterized protein n=1 Tax=Argopecten irradians TaxID=31199 RepID=UPI00371E9944